MFDVFAIESTSLDKAAAVTAIIPFVGCTVELASKANSTGVGVVDVIDSGLCYVGDALMLGDVTMPLGIVVHLSRYLLYFF